MKMMAAVLRSCDAQQPFATSKPISIEEVTLDPPGHSEVLVKVGGAGLCHSDLSVMNGARPRPVPMVLGHEGAGEVVEIGDSITDVAVGDHVVFQFSPSCGRCRRCLEGRPQVCELAARTKAAGDLMSGGRRLHDADGTALAGKHALITETSAGYAIRDLDSTNGTYVNLYRICQAEHTLRDGDRISLGGSDVTLIFNEGSAETHQPQAAAPASRTTEALRAL